MHADKVIEAYNTALNMALAPLILSFAVDGNMFQSSAVDQIARSVLPWLP
jgi:hypothetical protein